MNKVAIVNPNGRDVYGALQEYSAVEPPYWAVLWAAALFYWHDVQIIDAEALSLSVEETVDRLKDFNPSSVLVVVMGNNPSVSSTPKMPAAIRLLKAVHKEMKVVKMIGGLHTTALPLQTENELGDALDWIVTQPPSDLPVDFDSLEHAWNMLDLSKYRAHNWHCLDRLDKRSPYASLYTSFGCPYSCFYCNIHAGYGSRKVTYRDSELVVREIKYLHSRGVRNIKLADECFTLNKVHVKAICSGLEGLDLNIWAYAREDTLTPSLLETMRDAGIRWLAIGFDDKYSGDTIRDTRTLCAQADINIIANFMFGLPGDTMESMTERLALAIELNFEWANFYCAFPYPGSEWYDDLVKAGIKLPSDWAAYNQYSPSFMPLDIGGLKGSDILAFRDKAFYKYFGRPEYLEMAEHLFGACEYIEKMLEPRLVRA